MAESIIDLHAVLAAKEARQERQAEFRRRYGVPIISITTCMPGPVKDSADIRCLIQYALQALLALPGVQASQVIFPKTGPEAIIAIAADARELKNKCIALEDSQPFGRLLDIDVFTADGEILSRRDYGQVRECLVCRQDSVLCMREHKHALSEVIAVAQNLIVAFHAYRTHQISNLAEKISEKAIQAMLYEVSCTPAPGLVDRVNSGAHQDMDFYSFMASSAALGHTITRCVQAGINHDGPLAELLPVLRLIGCDGEQRMFYSTGGINTQKGLLFSMGITAAAAGWLSKADDFFPANKVVTVVQQIVGNIVERELGGLDFNIKQPMTAGERLFRQYGVRGIRGELQEGLPAVMNSALPAMRKAIKAGLSINDTLVQALLELMVQVEDTTIINRHDLDLTGWLYARVNEVLAAGGMYSEQGRELVQKLDCEFISKNISPGGSADLLAIAWFLYSLENM